MPHIKQVVSKTVPLGVMNLLGNKGGMVIQIWMFGKLFSFINCHLESGAGKSEARC